MKRTVRSSLDRILTRTTRQSVSTDGKPQSPSQQNNSSGAAIFRKWTVTCDPEVKFDL